MQTGSLIAGIVHYYFCTTYANSFTNDDEIQPAQIYQLWYTVISRLHPNVVPNYVRYIILRNNAAFSYETYAVFHNYTCSRGIIIPSFMSVTFLSMLLACLWKIEISNWKSEFMQKFKKLNPATKISKFCELYLLRLLMVNINDILKYSKGIHIRYFIQKYPRQSLIFYWNSDTSFLESIFCFFI